MSSGDNAEWKRAKALVASNSLKEAERVLIGIIVERPRDKAAWQELGTVYFRQKNYRAAIDAFQKQLEIDGNDASAHYSLAAAFDAVGRRSDTSKHLSRSLELQPGFPPAVKLQARLGERSREGPARAALPEAPPVPRRSTAKPSMTGIAKAVRIGQQQRGRSQAGRYVVQVVQFRLVRSQGLPPVSVQMEGTELQGTLVEGDEITLLGRDPSPGKSYVTDSVFNDTAGGPVTVGRASTPSFFAAHPNVVGFAFVFGVLFLIYLAILWRRQSFGG